MTLNVGGKTHKIHLKNIDMSMIDLDASEITITNTAESQACFLVESLVAEYKVPTNIPNAEKTMWL